VTLLFGLSVTDCCQGFTAVHIGAITATCWILLLNAAVGYQLLDDGTPVSLGLLVGSGLVFFIGTGYIALDTAFGWTGQFAPSHSDENRNYALYVLYLLWPLICLVVFYVMEAILVIRVLGEIRPMCMFFPRIVPVGETNMSSSLPHRVGSAVCNRPDFHFRNQRASVSGHGREDQRRPVRDAVHALSRCRALGLLEQYNRRRLADANWRSGI
jgi:hypothetical protein